ncbi:YidH family protein [Corynebacterium halotolerans]|uniref:YidH family protein n=1 Tax=Corynebacterium halotolerans TaxID=225326 RepID=UPI003CF15FFC
MDKRSFLARNLLPEGVEPDPRFTLANERTFLAWTRTSLAFLAGGIALAAFPFPDTSAATQSATAVSIIVIGLLISTGAAVRWIRVERAMRTGGPLPVPAIVPLIAIVVIVACAIAIWSLL